MTGTPSGAPPGSSGRPRLVRRLLDRRRADRSDGGFRRPASNRNTDPYDRSRPPDPGTGDGHRRDHGGHDGHSDHGGRRAHGRDNRNGRPNRSGRSRPPLILLVPAYLGLAFLTLPLLGLVVNAPWHGLASQLLSGETWEALRLSLTCATLATACSLLLGVPVGWLLARSDVPGRRLIRALVTVPLVLPPVVGGVALLFVLGRNGLVGQWLYAWFGISLPFSTAAVVIAETFVAMPFLILSVEGSLRSADRRYEEAAATLGASGWLAFRRVTLPLAGPGLLAGAILAWARALGEFGATITFAGNFPGTTQTMPLAVYVALERNPDEAVLLSLVLLAVSVVVLIALRNRWIPTGGER